MIQQKAINSIRVLSVDAVEKAKSGHPGLPLGAAPMAYELFSNHMRHNPNNPNWNNRDRFVLSAGHGSMLMYSMLHLFGYGLTLDDLKEFRQWNSKTPGHPEYGHTVGIETTTGPLGAGVATAVGMAMAEAHLAATFNKEGFPVVDHYSYALVGDGCLMEGVASEAMSLAGSIGLDKLIVLYDSNKITIEGSTDIAFRENVRQRMEAYGYQTLVVEDGNNLEAIAKAIEEAKANKDKPSFIEIKTVIGYGTPLAGTSKAHSDPMGEEKVKAFRETIGWESFEPFEIDDEVYHHFDDMKPKFQRYEDQWDELFANYRQAYPELAKQYEIYHSKELPVDLVNDEAFWNYGDKPQATRNVSGVILNYLKNKIPNLFGGSADLAPSNKTEMTDMGWFSKENYRGKNIHFGVRENGMAAITNGIVLHGGLRGYCATFFVFTDYMKPMMRLASLMEIPTVFVMTHDSIGVGEDGPTHEPIEQLSMLRAQPNMTVFRPADAKETAAGWLVALTQPKTPITLALSRQNLEQLDGSGPIAMKGGYVLKEHEKAQGILMASGSEVGLAIHTAKLLEEEGILVNVVSMPSLELFDSQPSDYKTKVLPKHLKKRLAIEAGATQSWYKYVGLDGKVFGIDRFGASAPGDRIFEEYGFTTENLAEIFKSL